MKKFKLHCARSQASSAFSTQPDPYILDIYSATIDLHVLACLSEKDDCKGPYTLWGRKGKTCTEKLVQHPVASKFRSTVVMRFISNHLESNGDTKTSSNGPTSNALILELYQIDIKGRSTRAAGDVIDEKLTSLRFKELNELIGRGVFSIIHKEKVKSLQIYGSRFVHTVESE